MMRRERRDERRKVYLGRRHVSFISSLPFILMASVGTANIHPSELVPDGCQLGGFSTGFAGALLEAFGEQWNLGD